MAKQKRKQVAHCKVCGRELKNDESIARGMGPTCERRVIGVVSRISAARPRPKRAAKYEAIGLLDLGDEDGKEGR